MERYQLLRNSKGVVDVNYLQQKKQAILSTHQGSIPSGYKQVEYLENIGVSKIYFPNISIPTFNTKMKIVAQKNKQDNKNHINKTLWSFGSLDSKSNFTIWERFDGSVIYVSTVGIEYYIGFNCLAKHTIELVRTSSTEAYFIINDKLKYIFTGKGFTSSTGLGRLFGDDYYSWQGKVYSVELCQDDIKILDLIPCIDNNNKPCMYDTVSKKTYYNEGTGEFLYGEVIN